MLRDTIELLGERLACAERRLRAAHIRQPYSLAERLHILWCIEYFGIPRRQIPKRFGVARSTVWRWLQRLQDGIGLCGKKCQLSVRRTAEELERLVWEMASANPEWGRRRMALVLATLGIFLAASTVRNILLRPKPRPEGTPAAAAGRPEEKKARQIVARYPNHVWSVDRTRVWRWRIWPTWALVAIDHFSRAVMAVAPLEGPNAGWVVEVLERAFSRHGSPKHTITDQEGVFASEVFRDLLWRWNVKQRFGAVGRHGSIAVTERLIRTLKYDWLRRVPVIRGLDHLEALVADFAYYLLQLLAAAHDLGRRGTKAHPCRTALAEAGSGGEGRPRSHRAPLLPRDSRHRLPPGERGIADFLRLLQQCAHRRRRSPRPGPSSWVVPPAASATVSPRKRTPQHRIRRPRRGRHGQCNDGSTPV
jgi:transposase